MSSGKVRCQSRAMYDDKPNLDFYNMSGYITLGLTSASVSSQDIGWKRMQYSEANQDQ